MNRWQRFARRAVVYLIVLGGIIWGLANAITASGSIGQRQEDDAS